MRRRGHSLQELVVGVFLLFLISSFLIGMFLQGSRNFRRAKERSIATTLAQSKLEELLVVPFEEIPVGSGRFGGDFQDYTFAVTVTPYQANLSVLAVTAIYQPANTSELGGQSTMDSLIRSQPFVGVATDQFASVAGFVDETTVGVRAVADDGTKSSVAMPPLPNGGRPGALAVDPFFSELWAADTLNHGVVSLANPLSAPVWSSLHTAPNMGIPAGIAVDANSSVVWIADRDNRALWLYNDNPGESGFSGPFVSPAPVLGEPTAVATDKFGTRVYVGDASNRCVRIFDGTTSTFDPVQYRPPSSQGVLNSPTGLACSEFGDVLLVVDSSNLWIFDVNANAWTAVLLPAAVQSNVPSGLSCDRFATTAFIVTQNSTLFKFTASDSSFVQVLP